MDLMSLIGWIIAALVLFGGITYSEGAIVLENLKSFIDIPSIIIVAGGVFAALMISFPGSMLKKIPKHFKIVLFPKKYNAKETIDQLVDLATEARINGLLSLESKLQETKDPFLKSSMMLVVDAVDPEKVKKLLETELEYMDDRHAQDRALYEKAAAYGPAYGMIGTLMGLVNLLKNLSDPDAIAPAMAVALVTTFYGSVLANMIFTPMANKLKVRHEEEYLCKMIIVEGVEAIQAGNNPNFIEEKLTQLLPSIAQGKGGKGSNKKEEK